MEKSNENLFIDLSHTIDNGLITFKGLPAPVICDYLSREESRKRYDPGTEFQIAKIEMVGNTGTYLDCPFHHCGIKLAGIDSHNIDNTAGMDDYIGKPVKLEELIDMLEKWTLHIGKFNSVN